MPFPHAERVIYRMNPLDSVICQLRFPPILTIETQIPDEFQECVRGDFPGFQVRQEPILQIGPDVSKEIPTEFLRRVMPSQTKNYEFLSEKGDWKLNLTRNFIALTAKEYRRWEDFKKMLEAPLNALRQVYNPAYFSRIGLRYVDVIRRSILSLSGAQWCDLLDSHILGLLGRTDVQNDIQGLEAKYELRLSDAGSMVRITIGLVQSPENDETCFMIDSDFYDTEKNNIEDTIAQLDYFHEQATNLIQSLMTPRLHAAMGPERI
jgi:uncharacterized protein (TIGR04255 family)